MTAVGTNWVPGITPSGTRYLTEETFTTLKNMLNSSDPGDHVMAQQILIQIDVQLSIFYIWLLSKDNRVNRMVNCRTKAGRAFRDAANLFGIAYLDEREFGAHLIDKGWMTPEIFIRLKPGIQKDAKKHNRHNQFYDFSIELKGELKHLDESDELIRLKNL